MSGEETGGQGQIRSERRVTIDAERESVTIQREGSDVTENVAVRGQL